MREFSTLNNKNNSTLNDLAGLIPEMALKARILEIVKAGYTKAAIARAGKVTPGAVSQWVSGDTKELKSQVAAGIQALTKFNAVWIATGKGPKHLESVTVRDDFDKNVSFVFLGKRAFPVISYIQAGLVKEITDPYALGDGVDIEYGDTWLSEWAFALEIEGNSMLPEFRPGDRILVDPMISPRPGDYVVAKNRKEEATFKKYRVRGVDAQGHDIFELQPLNEDFETMRSDEHSLTVVGVMVEHRKRYRRPRE